MWMYLAAFFIASVIGLFMSQPLLDRGLPVFLMYLPLLLLVVPYLIHRRRDNERRAREFKLVKRDP